MNFRSSSALLPTQPNQSLINGLDCLRLIAEADEPLGSREMSRRLGVGHATISRLANTLAHMQYLEKTPERKFIAGPGLYVLNAYGIQNSKLIRAAYPVLRKIGEERRYRVALGVLWNNQVTYLFFEDPNEDFIKGMLGHPPVPAMKSSIGWVLTAMRKEVLSEEEGNWLEESERKAILKQGYALRIPSRKQWLSVARPIGENATAAIALSSSEAIPLSAEELIERTAEMASDIHQVFDSAGTLSRLDLQGELE